MSRYFGISVFLLALVFAASAFTADKSSGDSGMVCSRTGGSGSNGTGIYGYAASSGTKSTKS
jgi:hypothetical protein